MTELTAGLQHHVRLDYSDRLTSGNPRTVLQHIRAQSVQETNNLRKLLGRQWEGSRHLMLQGLGNSFLQALDVVRVKWGRRTGYCSKPHLYLSKVVADRVWSPQSGGQVNHKCHDILDRRLSRGDSSNFQLSAVWRC